MCELEAPCHLSEVVVYARRMTTSVLVVEDSKVQRERLVAVLVARGYVVRTASGGLEALRELKSNPPDVVVLDLILDDMDGYSVCRWLRLSETTRDIVVIMLTARTDVKERVEGLHLGADDYVPKPYDDDELEARMFAALRSRNARLELRQRNVDLETLLSKTEHLAMTDALTGLFNRRHFTDVFKREWATARRYHHPISFLILDIDRFKAVNDTAGHGAGDDVLKAVAQIIASSIREVDLCARYGGDEFVVLLPHTPAAKASVAAERMRKKLTLARVTWAGEASKVSLSIGISSSEDPSLRGANEAVEAADRALYDAKRQGKDRAVVAAHGLIDRQD